MRALYTHSGYKTLASTNYLCRSRLGSQCTLYSFCYGDMVTGICPSWILRLCHRLIGSAVLTLRPRLFQIWIPSSWSPGLANSVWTPQMFPSAASNESLPKLGVYYPQRCISLLRQGASSGSPPTRPADWHVWTSCCCCLIWNLLTS